MVMKQLALDMGLAPGPTLGNFFHGSSGSGLDHAVKHLGLWVGTAQTAATRSPVPTYLWGASGCGKTHLLKAVREALRGQGASVGWLDPQAQEPTEFSEGWSAVLMDDVHLYSANQQHAAFNWFVNAQTHARWVLGAGNAPPDALQLRDDLRSRLGWGHVFALPVLSEPERRAVLRQAADDRSIFLSDEVMDFMLRRFSRDLGSLMDLLGQIDAYAWATKRAITIPMIRAMLEES
jgi:DnaA-homolog protein